MIKSHFEKLEVLFSAAPVNQEIFRLGEMEVSHGKSRYLWQVQPAFFHGAEALHGSAYFKLLDDAAYFASASLEETYFLVTKSFEIDFLRPVKEGQLTAEGLVIEQKNNAIYTQAQIIDERGKKVGLGKGIFVCSKKLLRELPEYSALD